MTYVPDCVLLHSTFETIMNVHWSDWDISVKHMLYGNELTSSIKGFLFRFQYTRKYT